MNLSVTFFRVVRHLTNLVFGVALLTGTMALSSVARADVSGFWSCVFTEIGHQDALPDVSLFDNGGVVSGAEYVNDGKGGIAKIADISGLATGDSYIVTATSIISNDSTTIKGSVIVAAGTMSGSWDNGNDSGGFSCTLSGPPIGVAPTPGPTPIATLAGNKRPTSTFLFCNRVGVNLSTADCSVTVGDAGAPPHSAPTGAVDFTATNGFIPSSGSCTLEQTPSSPGVVSCNAEFSIPANFPIGIAFPIDVTYEGDSVFDGSTTAHATIQAGCVGDASNPCSGAVALTFADIPQILLNAINAVFECGSTSAVKSLATGTVSHRGLLDGVAQCTGTVGANANLGAILANLDLSQIETVAHSISNKDAIGDGLLKAIQGLDNPKYQAQLEASINDQTKMLDLLNKIIQDQSKTAKDILNNVKSLDISDRAHKKISTLELGSANILVKNNSTKKFKIKLSSTAAKLFKALRKVEGGSLDVSLTMKGKHTSGPKKPFNKTFAVEVGLGK